MSKIIYIIAVAIAMVFPQDDPLKKKKEKKAVEKVYTQAQENLKMLEELSIQFDSLVNEADTTIYDTIQ